MNTTSRGTDEKPVGRRPILDTTLETKLADALRKGAHLNVAARASGISDSALTKWLKRGRDELTRIGALPDDDDLADVDPVEERYVSLVLTLDAAEADAELEAAATWSRAASYDWRAARDLLAARHPDRWGRRTSVTVTAEEAEKRVAAVADGILGDLGLGDDDDELRDEGQP